MEYMKFKTRIYECVREDYNAEINNPNTFILKPEKNIKLFAHFTTSNMLVETLTLLEEKKSKLNPYVLANNLNTCTKLGCYTIENIECGTLLRFRVNVPLLDEEGYSLPLALSGIDYASVVVTNALKVIAGKLTIKDYDSVIHNTKNFKDISEFPEN